jgi:N-acetylneuraminic acid mutarotase
MIIGNITPKQIHWSQKVPTNFNVRAGAVAVVVNGVAYIGTGDISGTPKSPVFTNDFYAYNQANDTWSIRTAVPGSPGGRFRGAAFAIGNKGYVGFGATAATVSGSKTPIGQSEKSFYEYNPAFGPGGTWTYKSYPPLNFGYMAASAFAIDGKGYIAGGFVPGYEAGYIFADGITTVFTFRYDPTTETWTQMADMPMSGRRHFAPAIVSYDRAYIVGGNWSIAAIGIDPCKYLNVCYRNTTMKFNPYLNTWTTMPANPMGYTATMTGTNHCDYGYVTAGRSASSDVDYGLRTTLPHTDIQILTMTI